MKSVIFALAALFSLGAVAESKIAVCDINGAIAQSDVAKKRFEELSAQSNLGVLRADGEGKMAEVKALQKDAEANSLTWSNDQKADYQKQMEYFKADLDLIERKMKAEQQSLQQKLFQELYPKAAEQLDALIKEEGVEILLKKEAVLWTGPATDLTNKLIDRINKNGK